ncbi:MAG TPA: AMP-binding protein, partial [Thermoplasmata archaeon]|nr:AMP-binding protein [Thermoplasmata archaeon]
MLEPGEEYHDLATLVRAKARKNGDRPALRFAGRTFSYRELDEATDRVAGGLAAAGIGPGDRVAALLLNTPEFPLLWFGAAKRRAILVPLNTALKGEILRYELADSAPSGLVVDRRLWGAYEPLRTAVPIPRCWLAGPADSTTPEPGGTVPFLDLERAPARPSEAAPGAADPVSIMYTSGTTGPPKGAIIPHQKQITTPVEIG